MSEKIEKMKNPNYKISDTKIVMKNVDKKLEKKFFLDLMISILFFKKEYKKKAQTLKIFSKILILKDEEKNKNRGIVFLDFNKPEFASVFMESIL